MIYLCVLPADRLSKVSKELWSVQANARLSFQRSDDCVITPDVRGLVNKHIKAEYVFIAWPGDCATALVTVELDVRPYFECFCKKSFSAKCETLLMTVFVFIEVRLLFAHVEFFPLAI